MVVVKNRVTQSNKLESFLVFGELKFFGSELVKQRLVLFVDAEKL